MKLNHQLERIVQNPGFKKKNSFDYSKGDLDEPVDIAFKTGDFKKYSKPLIRESNINFPKNIKILNIDDPDPINNYELLLVPVGFSKKEINEFFPDFSYYLYCAFSDVLIQFKYLNSSIPIPIEHIERYSYVNNQSANQIERKIQEITTFNGVGIVLNTKDFYGGSSNFTVFSGHNTNNLFLAVHEIGHELSLNDGYERFYLEEEFNNEELFTSLSKLSSRVRYATEKFNIPIYKTGNHYANRAVYRFYKEKDSIMAGDIEKFQKLIKSKEPIFNKLQIYLMNAYIHDLLKE